MEWSLAWPATLGQMHLVYDHRGGVLAYATWAYLTETVGRSLWANPDRPIHPAEWNEGDQVWVMDFVAPLGRRRLLAKAIKDLFADRPVLFGLRRKDGRRRPVRLSNRRFSADLRALSAS